MNGSHNAIDNAIADIDRLRRSLKKNKSKQVNSSDERSLIKAVGLAWFNSYRPEVITSADGDLLHDVDEAYKKVVSATVHATMRAKYDQLLKDARKELARIREYAITPSPSLDKRQTTDKVPEFTPFIADPKMQTILKKRWIECSNCLSAGAPLAATVMMGGLLEALLLARVNKEPNKAVIFKAKNAPKDKTGKKTYPLKEWVLSHYIDVAHELQWISQSAKDVGVILRDYRNYIHPYKELSHSIDLKEEDAQLLWEISKSIARQIINR